jgi:integrase
VSPKIGNLPVADIDTAAVLRVLQPIWKEMATANRIRGRIERVLAWSLVHGFRTADNPAAWKKHLQEALPPPRKLRTVKRTPALPYAEMPSFMAELKQRPGLPALALQFQCLTAVRSSDVRNCRRTDIDRKAKVWTIPSFSKTTKEHRTPLSAEALEVIDAATKIIDDIGIKSQYVFANDVSGAKLSGNAMLHVLKRMNLHGRMTPHGSRSCFRTWALEQTTYPRELSELCLGHSLGNAVEQAYLRGSALEKRRSIMNDWARFLSDLKEPGKVISLHTKV